MKNLIVSLATIGALTAASTTAFADDKKVDWDTYMRVPVAISAIGAAVSLASPCGKDLIFEETVSETERGIAIHCPGASGYDFSVFVRFNVYGDQIIPAGFDLAG